MRRSLLSVIAVGALVVGLAPAAQRGPRAVRVEPGRAGLSPCVWEAAVLAHERDAYSRHVLDGTGSLADRLMAWGADTVKGDVR